MPGEYESVAPTLYVNRVCEPLTNCAPEVYDGSRGIDGEYEWRQETETEDRVCNRLEICNSLTNLFPEWETVAPTPNSDRECAAVTPCSVQYEWELTAPTNTSDRVCRERMRCKVELASCATPMAPPPPGLDWTEWDDSLCEYIIREPSATSDRICAVATLCGVLEYEVSPPIVADVWTDTPTSDRICATLTTCRPGEVEAAAPTATSDRVCRAIDICNTLAEFEMAPPQKSTRTTTYCTCGPPGLNDTAASVVWTGLNNTAQFGSQPWDAAKWRVPHDPCCVDYHSPTAVGTAITTQSNLSKLSHEEEYWSVDRVCRPLTRCRLAAHLNARGTYTSIAATPTSDRVCSALTQCEPFTQWEEIPPTADSNRLCTDLTYCDFEGGETELLEPSLANDRACLPERVSTDGEAELSMHLNMSYSVAQADVHGFNERLINELARALGVSASRIVITRVAEGSIVVEFTLLPPDGESEGEADSAEVAGTFIALLQTGGGGYNSTTYPMLSKLIADEAPTFAVLRTGLAGYILAIVVITSYAYVVCGGLYLRNEVMKLRRGNAVSDLYSVEDEEDTEDKDKDKDADGEHEEVSGSEKSEYSDVSDGHSEPRDHEIVHANGGGRWLYIDRALGVLGFLGVILDFGFLRAVRNESVALLKGAEEFAIATGAETLGADADLAVELDSMAGSAMTAIIFRGLVVAASSFIFIVTYRRQLVTAHRQDNLDAWSLQASITELREEEAEEAAVRAVEAAALAVAEEAKKLKARLLWGKAPEPEPGAEGEEHLMFKEDLRILNFRSEKEVDEEMEARAEAAVEGAKMRALFNEIDEDGSGNLDTDEVKILLAKFGQKLSKKKLAKAFAEMDDDGSGEIDFDEFSTWYLKHKEGQRAKERAKEHKQAQKAKKAAKIGDMFGKKWSEEKEQELNEVWAEVDADGSGALDPGELQAALERMGMTGMNGKKLGRLMRQIDTDGDGTVDLDEFRAWWRKQSEKSKDRFTEQKPEEESASEVEAEPEHIIIMPGEQDEPQPIVTVVQGVDRGAEPAAQKPERIIQIIQPVDAEGSDQHGADTEDDGATVESGATGKSGKRRKRKGGDENDTEDNDNEPDDVGPPLSVEWIARAKLEKLDSQLATIVARLWLAEGRQVPHAFFQLFGMVCPELLLQLFWPPPLRALRTLLRSYASVAAAANIPMLTLQVQYAALRGLRPDVPGGGSNPTSGLRVLLVMALVASFLSVFLRLLPGLPRVCGEGVCVCLPWARKKMCCQKCRKVEIAPVLPETPYERAVWEAREATEGGSGDGSGSDGGQSDRSHRSDSSHKQMDGPGDRLRDSPPATPPTGTTRAPAALEDQPDPPTEGSPSSRRRRGRKTEH